MSADGLLWATSPHPDGHPKVVTAALVVAGGRTVDGAPYLYRMGLVHRDVHKAADDLVGKGWTVRWVPD